MKAVLISIQPKWVEKIASGEKTIEVRKTKPNLQTPFKVYIYCTIGNGVKGDYLVPSGIQCGKVIGEFFCDDVDEYGANCYGWYIYPMDETCLWADEIAGYGQGKPLYGWHITDLKIYDKPKELSEFKSVKVINRYHKKEYDKYEKLSHSHRVQVTYFDRPPQSWCYVED